jgi:predicted dehydrogenase
VSSLGRSVHGSLADDVSARLEFANGSRVELFASRIADARRRTMRLIYDDGSIDIDFLARTVRNHTSRRLNQLALHDPLGESVAAFVGAIQDGGSALVRPEEARHALETALLIEDATVVTPAQAAKEAIPLVA